MADPAAHPECVAKRNAVRNTSRPKSMKNIPLRKQMSIAVFLGFLAALVLLPLLFPGVRHHLLAALHWLQDHITGMGAWGPVICILLYVPLTLFFIPTTPLTVIVALSYGVLKGTAYALAGLTLGSSAAFLVARFLLRSWLRQRIGGHPLFQRIDEGIHRDRWRLIFLARMLPINPYFFLNYACGLTKVRFRTYLIASCIGMLPLVLVTVWTASAAGHLAAGKSYPGLLAGLLCGVFVLGVLSYLPRILRKRASAAGEDANSLSGVLGKSK
jgi:uncharacterized membrane protein YdjX (TVP38/TMEM64 family)